MNLRAIIIDDEPAAISSIEIILNDYCKNVVVVGKSTSPYDGIQLINDNKPDLVFLDIAMPGLNGIELLKTIPQRDFAVIFVTAFNDHAIEAFKVNAVDYILKPINIQDLVSAVGRVSQTHNMKKSVKNLQAFFEFYEGKATKKLIVNHIEGTDFINHSDIYCIKAEGNYSIIYTKDRKITTSKKLKELQEALDLKVFFRCHNSWLLNLDHILRFSSSESYAELVGGYKIPVSRRNKEEFLMHMTARYS